MPRRRFALALVLATALVTSAAAANVRTLRSTLDAHLAAINARDLDALLATVTSGEQLTLILPNGKVLETREQYRQLPADWFAESGWRMQFEVQQLREYGDVGVALVKYQSQARQADGSYTTRREALLSLVFTRENGQWRLVYDQNTVIPPASS
ncbi:MAG TPA: nuclear transport factor 2 family protein [Lysobacter sp.]